MTQKYKAVCLFFKYSYVKHRDVVGGGGNSPLHNNSFIPL